MKKSKRRPTVLVRQFYSNAQLRFKMPSLGGSEAMLSNIGYGSQKYNGVHATFCTAGRRRVCAQHEECDRVKAESVHDQCRILGVTFSGYRDRMSWETITRRLHAYYYKWFRRCRRVKVTIEEDP